MSVSGFTWILGLVEFGCLGFGFLHLWVLCCVFWVFGFRISGVECLVDLIVAIGYYRISAFLLFGLLALILVDFSLRVFLVCLGIGSARLDFGWLLSFSCDFGLVDFWFIWI